MNKADAVSRLAGAMDTLLEIKQELAAGPDNEPVDRSDIAWLAIGAADAMAKMDERQRQFKEGLGMDGVIDAVVDLAPMLYDLYLIVKERWDSVWYYEVAEPLGAWFVRTWSETGDQPTMQQATQKAREYVEKQMGEPI